MRRVLGLALLSLLALFPTGGRADGLVTGNWKLTTLSPMGNQETTTWLFKLEAKDGATEAKLVPAPTAAVPPTGSTKANPTQPPVSPLGNPVIAAKVIKAGKGGGDLVWFSRVGDHVHLVLKGNTVQVFEGVITGDGKKIVGVLGNNQSLVVAYMTATDSATLPAKAAGQKFKPTPAELKTLAGVASKLASEHGASAISEVNNQLALAYLAQKDAKSAVEFAMTAEKAMDPKSKMQIQVKVLQTLVTALKDSGHVAGMADFAERLNKLEDTLDREYLADVPPFRGKNFAGRKQESDRVVLMELFTGAQCPPCVAADVAFDALQKTYTRGELVLLEYHLHIPGPDPMTNADTENRAKYYGARSTPSTFFNGINKGSGGGAMAASEKKYTAYRGIIDPLLDTPATCKITAKAKRVDDKVFIQTDVADLKAPGKKIKLRLALVEESIRFLGSNGIRFHHQVVRAMPGGVDGVALPDSAFSVQNEVDLAALRNSQINYLNDYEANTRLFPQLLRPLDFHDLNVVAIVQDDTTKHILQVVQTNVVH